MKAVILEIKDGVAAALREDGVVVRTRQAGRVGDTIELTAEVSPVLLSRRKRLLRSAVAAVLALAVTGGTLTYTTTTASAYVTLDTEESSVELSVNHFGRVIGVRALNEASEDFASELAREVRHKPMEDALDRAVSRLESDGAPQMLVAGVTAHSDRRISAITDTVERCVDAGGFDDLDLYTLPVSPEQRRDAMRMDKSAARCAFEQRDDFRGWHPHDERDEDDRYDDWDDDRNRESGAREDFGPQGRPAPAPGKIMPGAPGRPVPGGVPGGAPSRDNSGDFADDVDDDIDIPTPPVQPEESI